MCVTSDKNYSRDEKILKYFEYSYLNIFMLENDSLFFTIHMITVEKEYKLFLRKGVTL